MLKSLLILCSLFTSTVANGSAQATVRVEPPNLQGPRALPEQTGKAAIRDYLQSWQNMSAALEQNRVDLLDPSFVGTARDKLTETIQQQTALGMHTRYEDRAHDIQIVLLTGGTFHRTYGRCRIRPADNRQRQGQNNTAYKRQIRHSFNTCRSAMEGASFPGSAQMMQNLESAVAVTVVSGGKER